MVRTLSCKSRSPDERDTLSMLFSLVPVPLPRDAAFGHINNVLYYAYMDDAVNQHLLDRGVGYDPRFVAASSCRYYEPLSYPTDIDVGLRVDKVGTSSVSYSLGLFSAPQGKDPPLDQPAAACGTFVHVYVDQSGRPIPISHQVRGILDELSRGESLN